MAFDLTLARPAALAQLRKCPEEVLTSLAYGETAPIPFLADVPAWLAEAAYDELDRRQFGQ